MDRQRASPKGGPRSRWRVAGDEEAPIKGKGEPGAIGIGENTRLCVEREVVLTWLNLLPCMEEVPRAVEKHGHVGFGQTVNIEHREGQQLPRDKHLAPPLAGLAVHA